MESMYSLLRAVLEVTILKDGEKNKCCGFIKFKRIDDAVRCVKNLYEKVQQNWQNDTTGTETK